MKNRKIKFPDKKILAVLIIFIVLSFTFGYIWRVLTTLEYFQVKDIVSKEVIKTDLSYLKGRNIFSLNLPKESANIIKSCPDCSRVRLARILPNRIYVEFVKRKPVAFIKLKNYPAIDESGVFFYSSIKPEESGLPLISGLEFKISPGPGKRHDSSRLSVAMDILRAVKRSAVLKDYRISNIDVADIDNIIIQVPLPQASASYVKAKNQSRADFLEIKISQGDINEKIAIMAGLINQEKQNLWDIKYIDLRFREPVIRFKDR